MVVIRDISDLVRAEYIRNLEKLTEVMIATTSHDMRTPLATIVNMLRLIEFKVKDKTILKWIKVVNNSTNLLQFLVNDTLDYF